MTRRPDRGDDMARKTVRILDDDEWAVLEHATRLLASRVGHRAAGRADVHSDAEAVFA